MDEPFVLGMCMTVLVSIAMSQAFVANISVLARWFPKKGRGLILAFWVWQEPFGDIWGGELNKFEGMDKLSDWGYPSLILGSVILIFGIRLFFFYVTSPEVKGFSIKEDYSLRDARALVHNADKAHMAERSRELLEEKAQKLPITLRDLIVQGELCTLALASGIFYYSFFYTFTNNIGFYDGEYFETDYNGGMYQKVGLTFGSLFGGILLDFISNQKARVLFLVTNGLLHALFSLLAIYILTDEDTTRYLLLVLGFFEYSTLTLLYAFMLDIAKEYEEKTQQTALCTFVGIVWGAMSFGEAVTKAANETGTAEGRLETAAILAIVPPVVLGAFYLIKLRR